MDSNQNNLMVKVLNADGVPVVDLGVDPVDGNRVSVKLSFNPEQEGIGGFIDQIYDLPELLSRASSVVTDLVYSYDLARESIRHRCPERHADPRAASGCHRQAGG